MKIYDQKLLRIWLGIRRHLTTNVTVYESNGLLSMDTASQRIYIAKNSQKMRLKSHLDWVYYTPKNLAQAIDLDLVDAYYELMFNDPNSTDNQWQDGNFEQYLKTFYAARAGRAELI